MKVAVIGSGIAGLVAARELARDYEVTVFEAGGHVGGHTHTHRITLGGRTLDVDSGFIVFNERTYPNFCRLLDTLGVESQDTPMSFSVRCERTRFEYAGTDFNALFAQRRNLVSPGFVRMLADIVRFNRVAPRDLAEGLGDIPLDEYLARYRFGSRFVSHYLVPMGAAIWSTDPARMLGFPAAFFIRFLVNHGLLSLTDRPQWKVISGGSARYVEKLTAPFADRIHLRTPVRRLVCDAAGVSVTTDETTAHFDAAFVACHADQALAMRHAPTPLEREILGAIPFQSNRAVLHTDASVMPCSRRAWAAWNYHLVDTDPTAQPVSLHYNMNVLQGLDTLHDVCVTLNGDDTMDPDTVIARMDYEHPVFTVAGVAAQARHAELNDEGRIYYCGAWWRYGFHEDGVVSALAALESFREHLEHAKLHLQRTA